MNIAQSATNENVFSSDDDAVAGGVAANESMLPLVGYDGLSELRHAGTARMNINTPTQGVIGLCIVRT